MIPNRRKWLESKKRQRTIEFYVAHKVFFDEFKNNLITAINKELLSKIESNKQEREINL